MLPCLNAIEWLEQVKWVTAARCRGWEKGGGSPMQRGIVRVQMFVAVALQRSKALRLNDLYG